MRALYTQTPQFNPYTPRRDQINRQELERLQSEHTDEDDMLIDVDTSNDNALSLHDASQRSGISSIRIKDDKSHRLARDHDRYKWSSSYRKIARASRKDEYDKATNISDDALPTPFTDSKLEGLLLDCQRRQRAGAAEKRQKGEEMNHDDQLQPFVYELVKAFASIDGFIAAFSKDAEGDAARIDKRSG